MKYISLREVVSKKRATRFVDVEGFADFLNESFLWEDSQEGFHFWHSVHWAVYYLHTGAKDIKFRDQVWK